MLKISKVLMLLFLVAQMSASMAGNPTHPTDRVHIGFWLVRLANDEIKQVKFVEMPANIFFEGTQDLNEPLLTELLGCKTMDTFEGQAVKETFLTVMSYDAGQDFSPADGFTIAQWCYAVEGDPAAACKGYGQCNKKPTPTLCQGGSGTCMPRGLTYTCAGAGRQ